MRPRRPGLPSRALWSRARLRCSYCTFPQKALSETFWALAEHAQKCLFLPRIEPAFQAVQQLCFVDQEFHEPNRPSLRFDGDAGKGTRTVRVSSLLAKNLTCGAKKASVIAQILPGTDSACAGRPLLLAPIALASLSPPLLRTHHPVADAE
jgi:hypothetical protein